MLRIFQEEILKIVSGRQLNSVVCEIGEFRISTDTRDLKGDEIFIALRGQNFNGNQFIRQADSLNAVIIIVDEIFETDRHFIEHECRACVILVRECLKAYSQLANYYRNQELKNSKIIGITGSVGKTTTKNLLNFVLKNLPKSVYASEANLNNQIGVSKSLLQAPAQSEVVILEMAMRAAGEINFLSETAEPEIAIVTNVSAAHLEFFENIAEIAKAKAEIFNHLKKDGWAILNKKNDYFDTLLSYALLKTKNVLTYSIDKTSNADIVLLKSEINLDNSVIVEIYIKDYGIIKYNLPLAIKSLIENSLIIFAVGKILGLDLEKISTTLSRFPLSDINGRGNIIVRKLRNNDVITIIDESYNSGFDAMKSALYNLGNLPFINFNIKRRIAFLGEMCELGETSRDLHSQLLKDFDKIDKIVTVGGDDIAFLNQKIESQKNLGHFNNVDELINQLNSIILDGDLILLKGANSNKMWKIIDCLHEI